MGLVSYFFRFFASIQKLAIHFLLRYLKKVILLKKMKKNRAIFLLCISLLLWSAKAKAQLTWKHAPIKLSYYSNMLINPGLSIGTEFILKEKTAKASKKIILNSTNNLKKKTWLLHGQLGGYSHIYSHSVLFTNYEIRYRRTTKRGTKYFAGLGLGVERSFLPETYEVKENGTIEKITLPGHFYAGPTLSMGMHIKRRFFATQNELFIEIQVPFLMDYNNTVLPKINFAFGMLIHQKEKK